MSKNDVIAENYFSPENNLKYMGSSQFKAFQKCEAAALADVKGEYVRPVSDALLIGSFVDAHFEGTLDIFKAHHPEVFTQKGTLKSQYQHAEYMIQRVERDSKFMQYMSGEKQKIFTGDIAGVPFKIKVDSYHPECIVDLKCIKDFKSIWNDSKGVKENFAIYWGYHIQGAIYREVVRQNTGNTLPFFLAAVTKEKPEPDFSLIHIDKDILDEALEEVKSLAPRFQKIKNGEIAPQRCEECAWCRHTKVLKEVVNLSELYEVYEVE